MKKFYIIAFVLLVFLIVNQSLNFASAQVVHAEQRQPNSTPSTSQVFGCTIIFTSHYCDPMLNEIKSYQRTLEFSTVADLYDQPHYDALGNSTGLKLEGHWMESLIIPNSPIINPAKFSVSLIIKNEDVPGSYSHILSHTNRDHNAGWSFELDATGNGDPFVHFKVTALDGSLSDTAVAVQNNTISHLVGTFDGSNVKLYKDDILVSQSRASQAYTSDPDVPIRIGSAAWSDSTSQWSGVIGRVMIFNNSLSAQDVGIISKVPISSNSETFKQKIVDGSLVGYWPLNGNINDISGQGHNADGIATLLSSMAFSPDGRLFVTVKDTGLIGIMKNGKFLNKPFAIISDSYVSWEQGLLGITLDPKFAENHFVYQYYTAIDRSSGKVFNRVVRFTENNNTATDARIILDRIPAMKGYHSGGAMAFGPDDKLYITVGDMTEHEFAQDPNILTGKILRIDRNGTIPADNPFPNSPVFTLGHRNMFGIAFDKDGNGFVTENGDGAYDSVNYIVKGGNYGFPDIQPPNKPEELADPTKAILPIRSYRITPAPTQMIYYTGDKFPELKGKFLFGTFDDKIYALTIDKGTHHVIKEEQFLIPHPKVYSSVTGIAQSPNGDIYFGSWHLRKIESLSQEANEILFPLTLKSSDSRYRIVELNADDVNKQLVLTIGPSVNALNGDTDPSVNAGGRTFRFNMNISKTVMDGVGSVTNGNGTNLDFKITPEGNSSSYSLLEVDGIDPSRDHQIVISAAHVIPEVAPDAMKVFFASSLAVVIVLNKRLLLLLRSIGSCIGRRSSN